MKTYKEQTIELIKNTKNAKTIFNLLTYICIGGDMNNKGYELTKMIIKNSNDFTKNIAEKWIEKYENCPAEAEDIDGCPATYVSMLSDKQLWCLTYQILNNKNVYLSK